MTGLRPLEVTVLCCSPIDVLSTAPFVPLVAGTFHVLHEGVPASRSKAVDRVNDNQYAATDSNSRFTVSRLEDFSGAIFHQ